MLAFKYLELVWPQFVLISEQTDVVDVQIFNPWLIIQKDYGIFLQTSRTYNIRQCYFFFFFFFFFYYS